MKGFSTEPTFNIALSTLIKEVVWYPIKDIKGEVLNVIKWKQPDIVVDLENSLPIIIECSYDGKDADKDAQSRLGLQTKDSKSVLTAISLRIPQNLED